MIGVETTINTVERVASCEDCDLTWRGKHALGAACRHASTHGHRAAAITRNVHTCVPHVGTSKLPAK